MYSLNGVNAINKVVKIISTNIETPTVTNTLSRVSLNANFSSKVSSFNTTNRYL